MSGITDIRIVSLLIAMASLVWAIVWWKQNHGSELYAGPVVIWALHLMMFNINALWPVFSSGAALLVSGPMVHEWTVGLRLHSAMTIVLLMYGFQRVRSRGILL